MFWSIQFDKVALKVCKNQCLLHYFIPRLLNITHTWSAILFSVSGNPQGSETIYYINQMPNMYLHFSLISYSILHLGWSYWSHMQHLKRLRIHNEFSYKTQHSLHSEAPEYHSHMVGHFVFTQWKSPGLRDHILQYVDIYTIKWPINPLSF